MQDDLKILISFAMEAYLIKENPRRVLFDLINI